MNKPSPDEPVEFRCGTPSHLEWGGPWKENPEAGLRPTYEEWIEYWESLRVWFERIYNLTPVPVRKRECFVVDQIFEDHTLQIEIEKSHLLNRGFLVHAQKWLQEKANSWRIAIPTDDTAENLILVYPNVIRINPPAEQDIEKFCEQIQLKLHEANVRARAKVGLNW